MNTRSYLENAAAGPLAKPDMAWFVVHAFVSAADAAHPRINLVGPTDFANLPSATVITAQIDPLRSENVRYGEALQAAGVAVEMINCAAVTQEFFGMGAVLPEAVDAMDFAIASLRAASGH